MQGTNAWDLEPTFFLLQIKLRVYTALGICLLQAGFKFGVQGCISITKAIITKVTSLRTQAEVYI